MQADESDAAPASKKGHERMCALLRLGRVTTFGCSPDAGKGSKPNLAQSPNVPWAAAAEGARQRSAGLLSTGSSRENSVKLGSEPEGDGSGGVIECLHVWNM